jgi:hypothetical protein
VVAVSGKELTLDYNAFKRSLLPRDSATFISAGSGVPVRFKVNDQGRMMLTIVGLDSPDIVGVRLAN